MKRLQKYGIDGFVLALVGSIILAYFLPQPGVYQGVVSLPKVANYGIALIFFFYGLKLSPKEMKEGLANWQLHTVIQAVVPGVSGRCAVGQGSGRWHVGFVILGWYFLPGRFAFHRIVFVVMVSMARGMCLQPFSMPRCPAWPEFYHAHLDGRRIVYGNGRREYRPCHIGAVCAGAAACFSGDAPAQTLWSMGFEKCTMAETVRPDRHPAHRLRIFL